MADMTDSHHSAAKLRRLAQEAVTPRVKELLLEMARGCDPQLRKNDPTPRRGTGAP